MKKYIVRALLAIGVVLFWLSILRPIYRDRIPAFGCFDDCFNVVAGHFLLQGKELYKEIFFNHQPLMAYVSAAVQQVTQPESLYQLIFEHRMTLIWYFMIWNVVLVLRFGLPGFLFSLLYEGSKGYFFGERFLAEGMIVYPLVFMLGILTRSHSNVTNDQRQTIYAYFESILVALLAWFVVFQREPYVPLAVVLYGLYLRRVRGDMPKAVVILVIFVFLSIGTIFFHDVEEYWFQVVMVNAQGVGGSEIQNKNLLGSGLIQMFLNPIFVLLPTGAWNHARVLEAGVSVVLLAGGVVLIQRKQWNALAAGIVVLGLANIRTTSPGDIYYAAFHHLVYWGMACWATAEIISNIKQDLRTDSSSTFVSLSVNGARSQAKRYHGIVLGYQPRTITNLRESRIIFQISKCTLTTTSRVGYYLLLIGYAYLSPQSYLHEKMDRQTEFTNGYNGYFVTGSLVNALAAPADTLFLDGWDDLIYWQAKRYSHYQYSWFTSGMPNFERFTTPRMEMLTARPPEFYYGRCDKTGTNTAQLPDGFADQYQEFAVSGRPSCLFIAKKTIDRIGRELVNQKASRFEYILPDLQTQ